jgi:PAS domain S-box-containing protein
VRAADPDRQLHAILDDSDLPGIDAALDEMGIGVFEWDVRSGSHLFSERCKRLWGFRAGEQMTAEALLGRVHPHDLHVAATVRGAISPAGPGRYSAEHRIVLPDGSVRWVQVSGQTLFDQDRTSALRGYGVMSDITSRKLAEQQRTEYRAQLLTFVERAPVPIAIFDTQMRYIAASERFTEVWRIPRAGLAGRSQYEVFPQMPRHWRQVQRRALAGAVESCDLELLEQPDGTREYVSWRLEPWRRTDGQVGGLILFCEVITARVKAQHALRDSQARLELAIRAGELGVYERDLTTGILHWDARARQMWGFDPDESLTTEMFIEGIHPDDRPQVEDAVRASLAAGGGIFDLEYRVINRRDGGLRWVASTGRAWTDGHVRIIGICQDITGRKRTELALEQLTGELRRADQHKNVYLATLSHELRNPLAPIRTAAHLLASPKLSAQDLRWISQLIRRQTAHMASLLEDLLEITRISRGQLTLRREHTLLPAITQPALESARPLIDEKRHQLRVQLPAEAVMVHADPARLSQVLSNLLTNAAKYTNPGGLIELSAAVKGDCLVLRVRDNGIGIPAKDIDKIFKMFWQADSGSSHARGGLGIGLSFVQGIVHLHGGTIEARSDGPGLGTEFIVHLPGCASPHQAAAPAAAPGAGAGLTHHRILVADDDRDTADTLKMLLTLAEHEVMVAHSGSEALGAARELKPDVALLDLSMPGLDGYDLARALRREPWAAKLRLIALTGRGQADDEHRAWDAGFHERLIKPVDPDRLRQLL